MALGRDQTRTADVSNRATIIWLVLLFALAFGLRFAFNMEPSFDEETDRYLYSGNDPYYHDRTVRHILDTGESLLYDESINYPTGGANPNPPIFDWTTATTVEAFGGFIESDPVGLILNHSAAFWGAITLFPVFMIGQALWGRKAGLWAAFFMGVSAPHIQRTVFGFADHDAAAMFFIALTFAFLIKALKALKDHEYVDTWKQGDHIREGFRRAFAQNQVALLWALLAGTAAASTALVWKGYPYVLGIMALGLGFQLLVDHARNKDSLALWLVYLIPLVMVIVVPWPYYSALGFIASTVQPSLYVLYGALIAGLILVPTRELPSILVFPAIALAGVLGILALIFVFPSVGNTIFTGLGYFQQSKLYSTIAEAQRTELGYVAANFGFFTFLLAFWGFGRATKRAWKGDAAMMLMAAWGVVAIFMAFAASRFVMNAAPVFAILAGTVTVTLTDLLKTSEVKRRFRALHGQTNGFMRGVRSLTTRTTVGAVLVVAFLVLPNLWLGVDAASPLEYDAERDTDKLGAFGLSFDIKQNGWLAAFNHLATLDTCRSSEDRVCQAGDPDYRPLGERPAFIAWWDYGHWATNLGKHPTVADPFQNHFNLAGRFLASESEREALLWLTVLMIEDDLLDGRLSAPVQQALEAHDPDLLQVASAGGNEGRYEVLDANLPEGDAYVLYDDVTAAHGKKVGYTAVDSRMFPSNARSSGIFYAPVFLADKNPDDFVPIVYRSQTGMKLTLHQYGMDAQNHSFRLEQPKVTDDEGNEWEVIITNPATQQGEAFRAGQPVVQGQGVPISADLERTDRFFNSMYARAYGSIVTSGPAPGDGLEHWRAIHESTSSLPDREDRLRNVVLLQYYSGYQVSGAVADANGAPLSGVEVTVTDGFGATHHAATTDATGAYDLLAPFGDDLTLTVEKDGATIYTTDFPEVTVAQAAGESMEGFDITIPLAKVSGFVYWDKDNDGSLDAEDEVRSGVHVTIGEENVTSNTDGRYALEGLQPGTYTVSASNTTGFEPFSQSITLSGGDEQDLDIRLRAAPSDVTVNFTADGEPAANVPIQFTGPQNVTRSTNTTGVAAAQLAPGTYQVEVDHTFTSSEGLEVTYRARKTLEVPFGGEPIPFTLENGEGYA